MKLHSLDISDIEILEEVFSFVNTDVVHYLELEKADYNIAASNTDAGHDLWAFWYNNRLKLPFWYNIAKDTALIQPSSAVRRPSSSTDFFLFFLCQGRSSLHCCAVYPCDIGVWPQFPALNLVFQYLKKNQNAPTVDLLSIPQSGGGGCQNV